MRRTLAIILFIAGISTAPFSLRAQELDAAQQEFVNAFLSVRKGEDQEKEGDGKAALATYRSAAAALARIKKESPNWQTELVDFRLKRTQEAIDRLQAKMGAMTAGTARGGANDPGVLPPLPGDETLGIETPAGSPPAMSAKAPKPTKVKLPAGGNLLDGVKEQFETLQSQLADTNQKLRDEQAKTAELAKKLSDALDGKKKAEDAKKKAQDLTEVYQKSMLDLKAKGDASSERVKELETKLAEVSRRSIETEVELASAEERISQLVGRTSVLSMKAKEAGTLPAQLKALQATLDEEKKADAARVEQAKKREDDLKMQIASLTKERDQNAKLPAQLKELQAKLDTEQKTAAAELAKAQKREEDLKGQIVSLTKERNDAKDELVRLKELSRQTDKLMADNAALLKKLGEAEKQILSFKNESSTRESDVVALKKQVTDTQKALAVSTEKSSTMQVELTDLQKKVADYSRQIAQYKTDKTASQDERRKMENENKLLQGIVMRVLQEDANRSQRKKMIQSEIGRLQIQSDVLLQQVNYLTQPIVKLSSAERRLFKQPVFDVQNPNALFVVKNDAAPAAETPALPPAIQPAETPAAPAANPAETPAQKPPAGDAAGLKLPPLPAPPASDPAKSPAPAIGTPPSAAETPAKPIELAKLDPPKTGVKSKTPDDLPAKDPSVTKPAGSTQGSGVPTLGNAKLPPEVQAIAAQAKQAFDKGKFTESDKLYDKALQIAPNNVPLLSDRAVVQFRMGKFKQAEESLRKVLSIAPEDAFAHSLQGIVFYSEDKFDDAVNSLTKSLAINPKNPTAHNYLGITAAQKGWMDAAQKELETALQLDPKYADAWFNLAVTHTLKQPPNKEDARVSYAKAVELGAEKDRAMEDLLK